MCEGVYYSNHKAEGNLLILSTPCDMKVLISFYFQCNYLHLQEAYCEDKPGNLITARLKLVFEKTQTLLLHVCHHLSSPCSAERESPVVHVYDGRGENKAIAVLDRLHSSPIAFMEVGGLIGSGE